jgi:putative membrane protein
MIRREAVGEAMARRTIRAACRWIVADRLTLTVEGIEHVPDRGPAVVAARHFHHLYDGCALAAALSRPVHVLVALDWAGSGGARRTLERACRLARWPTVIRAETMSRAGSQSGVHQAEAGRSVRQATRQVTDLLLAGQLVVIFPEGYPTIDPAGSRKIDAGAFLAFRAGVARLPALAERRGAGRVPIIPAGFAYQRLGSGRWRVRLRFGPPLLNRDYAGWRGLLQAVEERVIGLSEALPAGRPIAR